MIRALRHLFIRIVSLVRNQLNERQFLTLSSIMVGICCGLAAIILKSFAHSINVFVQRYSDNYEDFFLFTLFPVVGITLSTLYLRRFIKKKEFFKGSADIVYNIAKKSSNLPRSQMYTHIVSSAFTVGFGGSVGLESPLVNAGAAIGSNYSLSCRLNYKDKTLLLGCGSAAAIAAAFNSPIAGVLFAIEALLTDVSVSAFVPLIISAASGALLSQFILEEGVLLSFDTAQPFDPLNTPFYVLLGIFSGLMSLYYMRVFTRVERRMERFSNRYTKAMLGGICMAALLILFPPLFGEGYDSIKSLAQLDVQALTHTSILSSLIVNRWVGLVFLLLLMLVKVVAAAVTVGSGGNGGNFAPSLCVGGYLGYCFSDFINSMGWADLPQNNFTLVAMSGILSGLFHAPLTAIFLIAEITGGYSLMIPLMIVAAISIAVVKYFEPLSMESKKLATRMNLSIESRDKYLLSKLHLSRLIETNFVAVAPEDSLRELVNAISRSKRNLFPVVSEKGELVGVVLLDSVKEMIFDHTLYDAMKVKKVMSMPHALITPEESLDSVLRKFEDTDQWNLPVIQDGKYMGFLSKSSVLSEYREELRRSS